MTNKLLIVTISLGNRPWFKRVKKLMKLYAKKCGTDFHIINDNYQGDMQSRIRKLDIGNFLDKYDRVLFLDDTVIINPHSPNIFNIVPYNKIGVTLEKEPYYNKKNILINSLNYYQIPIDIKNDYIWFNSGVILISKVHKKLFEIPTIPIKKIGNYVDQAIFNSNRYKHNIPIIDLGLRYNYLGTRIKEEVPYKIDNIDNIYFYHVTRGLNNRQRRRAFNNILGIFGY